MKDFKNDERGRRAVGKRAFFLVSVGVMLPLVLIPFLTNYKPAEGWWWNIMHIKVAFGAAIVIPYRFILAFSVLLVFLGVKQLDLLRR